MNRHLRMTVLALVVLGIGLSACATINALFTKKELTPAARYYDALVTFNNNVSRYLEVYKLSDATTQAKWKKDIDPVVKTASTALDTWKKVLNTSESASKEQVWTDISKELLILLISSGIIQVQ